MSVTISIRVDDKIKNDLKDLEIDYTELIRNTLIKEIENKKALLTLEWLKKNALSPRGRDSTKIIREDRDSR